MAGNHHVVDLVPEPARTTPGNVLVIVENYGQSTICGRFLPRFLLTGSFRLFVMCSI